MIWSYFRIATAEPPATRTSPNETPIPMAVPTPRSDDPTGRLKFARALACRRRSPTWRVRFSQGGSSDSGGTIQSLMTRQKQGSNWKELTENGKCSTRKCQKSENMKVKGYILINTCRKPGNPKTNRTILRNNTTRVQRGSTRNLFLLKNRNRETGRILLLRQRVGGSPRIPTKEVFRGLTSGWEDCASTTTGSPRLIEIGNTTKHDPDRGHGTHSSCLPG